MTCAADQLLGGQCGRTFRQPRPHRRAAQVHRGHCNLNSPVRPMADKAFSGFGSCDEVLEYPLQNLVNPFAIHPLPIFLECGGLRFIAWCRSQAQHISTLDARSSKVIAMRGSWVSCRSTAAGDRIWGSSECVARRIFRLTTEPGLHPLP